MERRVKRWLNKLGLTDTVVQPHAEEAFSGYDNGCGHYSSGYEAGDAYAHILPQGRRSLDRDIRNLGDFLIDYGRFLAARSNYAG
jgi:hypothetical protein